MYWPNKYRNGETIVAAMRFAGTPAEGIEVYRWVEANTAGSFEPLSVMDGKVPQPKSGVSIDPSDGSLLIANQDGITKVRPGDYVVRDTSGNFYPCSADIFETSYQLVRRGEQ